MERFTVDYIILMLLGEFTSCSVFTKSKKRYHHPFNPCSTGLVAAGGGSAGDTSTGEGFWAWEVDCVGKGLWARDCVGKGLCEQGTEWTRDWEDLGVGETGLVQIYASGGPRSNQVGLGESASR